MVDTSETVVLVVADADVEDFHSCTVVVVVAVGVVEEVMVVVGRRMDNGTLRLGNLDTVGTAVVG